VSKDISVEQKDQMKIHLGGENREETFCLGDEGND
jgi:hypothetical protein